jgi:hypothetical protein
MTPVTSSLNRPSPTQPVISIFVNYPQGGVRETEVNNSVRYAKNEHYDVFATLQQNSQSWRKGSCWRASWSYGLLQKPEIIYEVPSIITSLQGDSAAHLGNMAGAPVMTKRIRISP